MEFFAVLVLLSLLVFLAVERSTTAREYFEERERWYRREKELQAQNVELLNRLLYRNAVEPLPVGELREREQTLKLADIDTPVLTPVDEALFVDDVLEEMEQHRPELRGQTAEDARAQYPGLWAQMEQVVKARSVPLVIG